MRIQVTLRGRGPPSAKHRDRSLVPGGFELASRLGFECPSERRPPRDRSPDAEVLSRGAPRCDHVEARTERQRRAGRVPLHERQREHVGRRFRGVGPSVRGVVSAQESQVAARAEGNRGAGLDA